MTPQVAVRIKGRILTRDRKPALGCGADERLSQEGKGVVVGEKKSEGSASKGKQNKGQNKT